MTSLFVCHGAPTLAVQENEYVRFLRTLSSRLPRPDGVVLFSAHWEAPVLSFTERDDAHETIHDFYGFPEELYRIRYPAKGSAALARQLRERLKAAGIPALGDPNRGLDHGAWVVLKLLYPDADIPVVAVSVNPALPPQEQYRIGRALAPLRRQNVLIVGSGATCHNLRLLQWDATEPAAWAVAFDDWLVEQVEKWDLDALFAYETLAPHARLAVPRNEHLVPLFLAMGSAGESPRAKLLYRSYDLGTLSLVAFQFG